MHPNPALSVLYVLTECIHTEGYLTAYKVDPSTGGMKELGRVTLTGRSSCYISFDKYAHHAIITNYWDGLINVVELSPAGVPLRVVQEHQQTRRAAWRQVESREVSCCALTCVCCIVCTGDVLGPCPYIVHVFSVSCSFSCPASGLGSSLGLICTGGLLFKLSSWLQVADMRAELCAGPCTLHLSCSFCFSASLPAAACGLLHAVGMLSG